MGGRLIILEDCIILENNECKAASLVGAEDIKLQYKHIDKVIGQASRIVYDARSRVAVELLLENIDKIKDAKIIYPMSFLDSESSIEERVADLCWYSTFLCESKIVNTEEQRLLSILVLRAIICTHRELCSAGVSISSNGVIQAKVQLPYGIRRMDGYMAHICSTCNVTAEMVENISDELWKNGMFMLCYDFNRFINQGQRDTIHICKNKPGFKDDDTSIIQEILTRYGIETLDIRRYNWV